MTVEVRQLRDGSGTWEAKVIDPTDGYVLWVEWASSKDRVVKRAEKYIRKAQA